MKLLIFCLMILFSVGQIEGQVTIGAANRPVDGALLDLSGGQSGSSPIIVSKGLGMPRVALTSSSDLFPMFAKEDGTATNEYATNKAETQSIDKEHVGLMVYNVKSEGTSASRLCPGMHVWDGEMWQPLVPYLATTEDEILISSELIGYTFLDPTNPSDPMWATLGKNPSNYPIGETKLFTDTRDASNEQYYYTRYYVGYVNVKNTYHIVRNYSCDQNESATSITPVQYEGFLFDDGVWMNQNIRAKVMDPKRTISYEAPLALEQSYNQSPVPNPPNFARVAWNYTGTTNVPDARFAPMGLLYTWSAATNGKGGAAGTAAKNEGGTLEGGVVQGICPFGWHLASDREWTTLENGIIRKTSTFSSTPDIGGTAIPYGNTQASVTWRGTIHGQAMKTTVLPSVTGTDPKGTSNLPNASVGGFNLTHAGYAGVASADKPVNYSSQAFYWTSSSSDVGAWYRYTQTNEVGDNHRKIQRGTAGRNFMHTVRCAKDQER